MKSLILSFHFSGDELNPLKGLKLKLKTNNKCFFFYLILRKPCFSLLNIKNKKLSFIYNVN